MSTFRRFGALVLPLLAWLSIGCTKDVSIGAVISETGGLAPYGHQVTRGLDLALEQINAAGGFKGGQIQLIYKNDESNPDVGLAAVKALTELEGARIIVGAISSQVTLKIAPYCEKNRLLLLSPTASAPAITQAGEYIFRNYPSDILEGTAMADFAKGLGLRRVMIVALDNEFGEGLSEIFGERFESRSREIVESFEVAEGDMEALAAVIDSVKEQKPQGIYVAAYQDEMVSLLEKLREVKFKGVIMASSAVTNELPRLAGDAANGLVFPRPSFDIESTDEQVASFVAAYREKYSKDPDIWAAHGYDALKLILASMEETGSSHPEDVRRGFLNLEYQGAAGRTSFDEHGDVVRYPQKFVIRDGRPVPYEKFEQEGGELPFPQ